LIERTHWPQEDYPVQDEYPAQEALQESFPPLPLPGTGQTSAETAERTADKAVRELQKDAQEEEERRRSVQLMPPDPCANVDLGDNGVVDEEPPDDMDEGDEDYGGINDQDLTMAYDEVMGGW